MRTGHLVFAILGGMALAALTAFSQSGAPAASPQGPTQPLPYSHKIHAGTLNLPCKTCHANADPGEKMGFPAVSTCMQCHRAVKKESPAIQKLAAIAQEGGDIAWVRVYELPSYVYFSHRAHSKAGAKCMDCHGQVSAREVLFKEGDISMGACMDCHVKNKASVDCQYCHEPIEQ